MIYCVLINNKSNKYIMIGVIWNARIEKSIIFR